MSDCLHLHYYIDQAKGIHVWGMFKVNWKIVTIISYHHPDRPNITNQTKYTLHDFVASYATRSNPSGYSSDTIQSIIKKKKKNKDLTITDMYEIDKIVPGMKNTINGILVLVRLSE